MRRIMGLVAVAVLAIGAAGCGGGGIEEGLPSDTQAAPDPNMEAKLSKMGEGMVKGEKAPTPAAKATRK